MSCTTARMDPERIILSEVSPIQTHTIPPICRIRKSGVNLFIKQEQIYRYQKQTYVTRRETWQGRDKSTAWDEHTQTVIYKIDNEQGRPIEHRELYSIFCDHL